MAVMSADTNAANQARNLIESADTLAMVYADDAYHGERYKRAVWRDIVHCGASQTFAGLDEAEYTLTVYAYTDKRTTRTMVVTVILRVYDGLYNTLGADVVYSDMLYKMYRHSTGDTLAAVEHVLNETRMYRLRPRAYKTFADTERKLIAAM